MTVLGDTLKHIQVGDWICRKSDPLVRKHCSL